MRVSAPIVPIIVFSIVANLLILTGPLFMLQVYDRVLNSGSEETLAVLFSLVLALYAVMALLDICRARLSARIGARVQAQYDPLVAQAGIDRAVAGGPQGAMDGIRDVDAVQRLFAGPTFGAMLDLPWTPFFLAVIFVFHPLLGWLAVGGMLCLVLLAGISHLATRRSRRLASEARVQGDGVFREISQSPELIVGLGLGSNTLRRWQKNRNEEVLTSLTTAERSRGFAAVSKSIRFALQSAMLALGALLVLRGVLTPGAMIAASILLARALSPVDQAINGWSTLQRAVRAWRSLKTCTGHVSPDAGKLRLPKPAARISLERVTVFAPKAQRATLRALSFAVDPGTVLGVVGPSGSGKSSLARVLSGVWRPTSGAVRLGDVPYEHYRHTDLTKHIGYLPQDTFLFSGTVAENIAGFDPHLTAQEVLAAAQLAGVHQLIVDLPQGYDTPVSAPGAPLSGGQRQLIGLARALYREPQVVILDEPNAHLDADGQATINATIKRLKQAGRAVIVMAHRPGALMECDHILVLQDGARSAYGPRDAVLEQILRQPKAPQTLSALETTI
ncbi:MAG: type I secretion system permease/ATPase [Pseudomonadota bacterium]